MADKNSWKTNLQEFAAAYETARTAHPDWTTEQIAASLNKSRITASRMLAVLRHMNDPRIAASVTLNQAYNKITTYYRSQEKTISEVTSIVDSIIPTTGEDK